jgi:hypothetical protein
VSLTENNLLVIDEDDDFIDEAKRLFDGGCRPPARSTTPCQAIEGGNLRMVILGPSYRPRIRARSVRTCGPPTRR